METLLPADSAKKTVQAPRSERHACQHDTQPPSVNVWTTGTHCTALDRLKPRDLGETFRVQAMFRPWVSWAIWSKHW